MLLTAIYNVLKENKSYNAKIYCQTDKPPVQRTVTVDEVVYILLRQEYIVIPSQYDRYANLFWPFNAGLFAIHFYSVLYFSSFDFLFQPFYDNPFRPFMEAVAIPF